MKKTSRLRELINRKEILVVPGGFSPIVGMIAEQIGFQAMYMSGYGVSAYKLGMPDVGLMTMPEALETAKAMARVIQIPLICDVDTGYGNALNVLRTVEEFESIGVAGIQIEDQVWPKRCGHMEGKELIPAERMVGHLQAALDGRQDKDFIIVARTDARTVLGFDEAIRRANLYAQAGADVIFVESPISLKEIEDIPRLVKAPLLINMSEGAKTPLLTSKELQDLGYKVVIWPSSSTWAVGKAIEVVLRELRDKGTTVDVMEKMMVFPEFNKLLGLEKVMGLQKKYTSS
jgi:2,3-dimethylmalate lyase